MDSLWKRSVSAEKRFRNRFPTRAIRNQQARMLFSSLNYQANNKNDKHFAPPVILKYFLWLNNIIRKKTLIILYLELEQLLKYFIELLI